MDLNELLHAHQLEVMKASSSADQGHFNRIATYAARIKELRTVEAAKPIAQDMSAPPTIIYGSYAGGDPSNGDATTHSRSADDAARNESENPDRGHTDD